MTAQGFNINEAAEKLGVSTRTIRRYIKAGKIRAELIKGSFGDEYRILELPPQFDPNLITDEESQAEEESSAEGGTFSGLDLIRELQSKNLALAAQLGAAAERIRNLEGQLKLLAPPAETQEKMPRTHWWQRIKGIFTARSNG
jgi:excisionase family DNA binding protein